MSFAARLALALGVLVGAAEPVLTAQEPPQQPRGGTLAGVKRPRPAARRVDEFKLRSECVSGFWKSDRFVEAGVVRPLDWQQGERLPVAYSIHGFGGDHEIAWVQGPHLQQRMQTGAAPRMLYVYLNAQFEWGHHEFADSRCNGPWGKALTEEFIPALEREFGAVGEPGARFLTGHSSGGWSSLWLQVTYPDFFGGCWATAPDPVDFRDFTGIDIYSYENAFTDPEGRPIMLIRRRNSDEFTTSIRQFVSAEQMRGPVGGQFFSFNAVFGGKGADGMPRPLFDAKTGVIDPEVADSWRPYDISLVLREQWKTLGPKLAGKIHVYMGLLDTFRLEGATILLKEELESLGSDAQILLVEGRDHGTLISPHPELWPKGMHDRIHREMYESYQRSAAAAR